LLKSFTNPLLSNFFLFIFNYPDNNAFAMFALAPQHKTTPFHTTGSMQHGDGTPAMTAPDRVKYLDSGVCRDLFPQTPSRIAEIFH
jgi:hypothetical protein